MKNPVAVLKVKVERVGRDDTYEWFEDGACCLNKLYNADTSCKTPADVAEVISYVDTLQAYLETKEDYEIERTA